MGGMTAESIGRSFVGIAGIGSIGALCYYGTGLGGQGTVDYAYMWPKYVRNRVQTTFMYFGGGLALTAASSALLFRSGVAHRMMTMNPIPALILTLGLNIGSMYLCMSTRYDNTGLKHGAWALFNGSVGLCLAPMAMLGGPLLLRAAMYTGVVVGGLTAIAACAPNEEFLHMGGALSIGLGVVIISSLGPMLLPVGSAVASGMQAISLYGGTVLFGAFVLYDTQKIILHAEQSELTYYDPINESIGIYLDSINLFVRIATMLAGNNKKK